MTKLNLARRASQPATDHPAGSRGTRSATHILARAEQLAPSGPSRWLVAAYVAVALPVALFYLVAVPAFDVADEPNHFLRAEHLTHGGMFGEVGGLVDEGAVELIRLFPGMHPPPPESLVKAWKIPWRGTLGHGHFPNTVRYPPLCYLPQMLGIALGKALHLPVLASVYLARLSNALATLAFSAWVLLCCRRGAWMMAWVLTLPMLTDEMASCSQDAALICCGAAAAALVSHGTQLTRRRYYLLAALLTLCIAGRPPLVSLLLMLLLPAFGRSVGIRRQALTTVLALLVMATWFALSTSANVVMMTGVDVKEQLRYVLGHPGVYARTAAGDFLHNAGSYWRGMVGLLGWQTVPLSRRAYQFALLALGLQAWALSTQSTTLRKSDRGLVLLAGLGTWPLMQLGTYLTWNAVGAATIEGMQGRYFLTTLPVVMMAAPCLGKALPHICSARLGKAVTIAAALAALMTMGSGVRALQQRVSWAYSFPQLSADEGYGSQSGTVNSF